LIDYANLEQLPEVLPLPINKESEMKTYQKARLLLWQHHIFLVLSVIFTILWVIFAFGTLVEPEMPKGIPMIFFFVAAFFWVGFGNIMYQINRL